MKNAMPNVTIKDGMLMKSNAPVPTAIHPMIMNNTPAKLIPIPIN